MRAVGKTTPKPELYLLFLHELSHLIFIEILLIRDHYPYFINNNNKTKQKLRKIFNNPTFISDSILDRCYSETQPSCGKTPKIIHFYCYIFITSSMLTINILIYFILALLNSQDHIAKGDIAYIQTVMCQTKNSHSFSCFWRNIFFKKN